MQSSVSMPLTVTENQTHVISLLAPDQVINIYEELKNILNKIETDGILIKSNEFAKLNFMFQDLCINCENEAQLIEIRKLSDRLLVSQKENHLYPIIELQINSYNDLQNAMSIQKHNIEKQSTINRINSHNKQQISEIMEIEKTENNKRQRKSPIPADEFVKPKKSCFLSKYVKERTEPRPVTTRNRFAELSDESSCDDETEETPKSHNTQQKSNGETKKFKLPPIVIHKKFQNHKSLTQDLSKTLTKGFYLKFTNASTLIFAEDENEHKQLLKELEDTEIDHHSYTLRTEKSHAFVLRGLDTDPPLQEIDEALQEEYQIKLQKIFKMKTKVRPLYLVTTDAAITLNWLSKNVRYLLSTRIFWERRRSDKEMIQCHRCQVWGHATTNCRHPHRCLKCAKNHPTYTCTKPIDEPAKCANCGKDHPANSVQCSVYQDKLQRIQAQKSQPPASNTKPFIVNKEQFPSLPVRKIQPSVSVPQTVQWPLQNPQLIQKRQAVSMNNTDARRNHGQDFSLMEAITGELNKLNNKIDLNQVLLAISELNQRLETATNNFDVILIMQAFREDVNQFSFFKNVN